MRSVDWPAASASSYGRLSWVPIHVHPREAVPRAHP